MSYQKIMDFVGEQKESIIDEMKRKLAMQFIANINNHSFDKDQELDELKVEARALERVDEILETVLEKMGEGEKITWKKSEPG